MDCLSYVFEVTEYKSKVKNAKKQIEYILLFNSPYVSQVLFNIPF